LHCAHTGGITRRSLQLQLVEEDGRKSDHDEEQQEENRQDDGEFGRSRAAIV
jgi:hypothetical protein